jgi:hypothetical protein
MSVAVTATSFSALPNSDTPGAPAHRRTGPFGRSAPQRAATRRNAPQRAATRRNAPQRAATRRNARIQPRPQAHALASPVMKLKLIFVEPEPGTTVETTHCSATCNASLSSDRVVCVG